MEVSINNSNMYWCAFSPNQSWLHDFLNNIISPDFHIWPEESDGIPNWYFWSSNHFDDAISLQELSDRMIAFKAMFDGAMLLTFGESYHPISLGKIEADSNAPLRPHGNIYGDVTAEPFSISVIANNSSGAYDPLRRVVSRLIFQARYDIISKDILKFIGVQGLSYIALYALTDWLRKGKGWDAKRIASEAGWSNAKYNNFTETANNPAYLGPFCRHGGSKTLPSRPVPLNEALDPIRKATLVFLEERFDDLKISNKWQSLI